MYWDFVPTAGQNRIFIWIVRKCYPTHTIYLGGRGWFHIVWGHWNIQIQLQNLSASLFMKSCIKLIKAKQTKNLLICTPGSNANFHVKNCYHSKKMIMTHIKGWCMEGDQQSFSRMVHLKISSGQHPSLNFSWVAQLLFAEKVLFWKWLSQNLEALIT